MTDAGPTTRTVLDTATTALELGLCPVPPRTDGTKAPDGPALDGAPGWKRWQTQLPTADQVRRAFTGRDGIGLMCGQVSGNLEMLEFEGRAIAEGLAGAFALAADDVGAAELWDRVLTGYCERTPSGGIHVLYSCPTIEGNLKLARRPSTDDELTSSPEEQLQVLIETRGEGGYTVIAPSHGTTHATGNPWEIIHGGLETIAIITPADRATLLAIARTFDRIPRPERQAPNAPPAPGSANGDRPGDLFNAEHSAQQVLEDAGFVFHHQDHDGIHYTRPGKDPRLGSSATVWTRDGRVTLFSSSIDAPPEIIGTTRLDAWRLHVALHHHGDHSEAARDWRADHRTERPLDTPCANGHDDPDPTDPGPIAPPELDDRHVDTTDDQRQPSSWVPVDLAAVLRGDHEPLLPTELARTDGACLLYPGKCHSLHGEPESGKTWAALLAFQQTIERHELALYIDFEDDEYSFTERLLAMGSTAETIATWARYLNPVEPLIDGKARITTGGLDFAELLQHDVFTLAVIDGVTESMSIHGWDAGANVDYAQWHHILPRRLARLGTAVVQIDHVTKSKDDRGRWAIGAQHKLAAIDGAAYAFEIIRPAGRGQHGISKITVEKDRPGQIRQHATGKRIADLHIDATGPTLSVTLEPVDSAVTESGGFRPTHLMEKVSRYVETHPGTTTNDITETVTGKAEYLRQAITALIDEGHIEVTDGPKRSKLHTVVSPFREHPEEAAE